MNQQNQMDRSARVAIGFMLFALFFGAGNLIFPAQLGQEAGTSLVPAISGFLLTGVGLPLLGILAIGFSGSENLQHLASRVHPTYGLFFTSLLYLTIGPFSAAPRTGTVAYEIGIAPLIGDAAGQTALFIFTLVFFGITLFFSLYPTKLVDIIGKLLAPTLFVLLAILLAIAVFNPMGPIQSPIEAYEEGAFIRGFLEGYNTMDALASLVFGMIVITSIHSFGLRTKGQVFIELSKSGLIATVLLGIIYIGIAYLGATSVSTLGMFDNGGPVLNGAASHYFGTFGSLILMAVIMLACLTTAIGLVTANAEYFHMLFPKVSYRAFAIFFATLTFIIANFGLTNIINFSIPMLMFLYPLAIVLMLLTFVAPLFNNARVIYVATIAVTFVLSLVDGLVALCDSLDISFQWLASLTGFLDRILPFYSQGLGWLIPALITIVISGIYAKVTKAEPA